MFGLDLDQRSRSRFCVSDVHRRLESLLLWVSRAWKVSEALMHLTRCLLILWSCCSDRLLHVAVLGFVCIMHHVLVFFFLGLLQDSVCMSWRRRELSLSHAKSVLGLLSISYSRKTLRVARMVGFGPPGSWFPRLFGRGLFFFFPRIFTRHIISSDPRLRSTLGI